MISPNLLVIRAADIRETASFYEALGMRFHSERHGSSAEHLASQIGDFIFEIYPLAGNTSTTATRIGFTVDSLDDAVNCAAAVHGKVITKPAQSAWGRRAVLMDPEGHKVELTERLPGLCK